VRRTFWPPKWLLLKHGRKKNRMQIWMDSAQCIEMDGGIITPK
jgi:hypothetical protein